MRRFLLLLLSPALLVIAFLSVIVGLAFYAETNPAAVYVLTQAPGSVQAERALYLFSRLVLLPFQLVFIFLAFAAAAWIFRRRLRIGAWVMGEPFSGRLAAVEEYGEGLPAVLRPERRRTLQQIVASIIAVLALLAAVVLSLGQFVPRGELAVVIAALTSGLTWGARLPVGDFLGGITNIFETTVTVGERIQYRVLSERVEGVVESMDLRFLDVRADSGELTTIPHGELRVFRNYSRGQEVGVYATFPVAANDLSRAVALLSELAPESPSLTPLLTAPWHVMSLDGRLGRVVDLSLYGHTNEGQENELRLALHTLVNVRLAAEGISVGGPTEAGQ